jgi:hypothetical protein
MFSTLDDIGPTTIIEGCARGADKIAEDYGQAHRLPVEHYPASWVTNGRAAGPIRNAQMLERGKPELVVAFDLGTPGTADMVRKAIAAGVKVRVITPVEVGLGL